MDGTLEWLITDDARGLLAYERVLGDQRAVVAFNLADAPAEASVPAEGRYRRAYPDGDTITAAGGKLTVRLPPRSGAVWIRERAP